MIGFKPFSGVTWAGLKDKWHGLLTPEDEHEVGLITQTAVEVQTEDVKMSFLATLAKDAKAVFAFLGSSKGQAVVTGVETTVAGVAAAVNPAAAAAITGGFALLNNWMAEALKMETLAAAAGSQTGSGTTKAAAVLSTMVPELTTYLNNAGYTSANVTAKATTINNLIVSLLNTLEAPDGVQQEQIAAQTVIPPATA
jgi:hypothetical protein